MAHVSRFHGLIKNVVAIPNDISYFNSELDCVSGLLLALYESYFFVISEISWKVYFVVLQILVLALLCNSLSYRIITTAKL